jgi:hypothetical protein
MFTKDDNDKIKKHNTYGKINKISKINQPMKNVLPKKKKSSQKIIKPRKIKSNYLIIKKTLQNHNITKKEYDIIMINNIMNSNSSHFLVCYKEHNLIGFIDEYLRRFYHEKESKDRLPKISKYYHNYSLFFCKPTFRVSYANKILRENGERQAKYFYTYNYERNDEEKKEKRKKSLNKKYEKIFNDDIIKDIDGISTFYEFNKSYSISIPDITLNSYKFSNESSFKSILNCFNNENNNNNYKNNKNNKNIKNIVPAIKNFNKVIKVEKRDINVVNSPNKKKKPISQLQLKKNDSTNNKNISHTYRLSQMDKKMSIKIFSDLSTNNSIKKNTSFNNKLTFRHVSKNKNEKEIKENLKTKTKKNCSSNKSRNSNRKKLSLNWNFNTITQNENIYNTIINNKGIKSNLNLNELIDIFHTNTERNQNKDNIITFTSPTINNINININNNICINTNTIENKNSKSIQKSRNNHSKNIKSDLIKTTKSNTFKTKNIKNDTNLYKTNYIAYSARKPKLFISPITNNKNMSPRILNKINKEKSSKKMLSAGQKHKTTQIIKVQKAIFKKPKNN